ncbi:MAG: ABC transporter ATP-binding protein [Armatimonadetes bacterium]|nr:ABC transporter ATP-binding protein [Armatimonadota bacterium]
MNAVQADQLGKTYGKTGRALEEVSFSVEKGEIFGFIGGNGAGKTTAIKILVGLVNPSHGSALIFEHPAGTREAKEKIGYLPEVSNYPDWIPSGRLLDFYASLSHSSPPGKEWISSLFSLVGLSGKEKIPLRQFSKGMMQRFGLAQSLVGDAPLLLLDEPTSGLDPQAQREMKDLLLSLREKGKTLFFSSHQLSHVEEICDRIGILKDGRLVACASVTSLLDQEGPFEITASPGTEALAGIAPVAPQARVAVMDGKVLVPQEQLIPALEFLRAKGVHIQGVEKKRPSLEDVFLNMVRKGPGANEKGDRP